MQVFLLHNSLLGSEKAAGNHQMNIAYTDTNLQANTLALR